LFFGMVKARLKRRYKECTKTNLVQIVAEVLVECENCFSCISKMWLYSYGI
jgi:hypothetical protein